MTLLAKYLNGNATVELYNDGTRVIQYEGDLKLKYPLNIDIRVSTACSFGYNPSTGKSTCTFCHESNRVDGTECDYSELREVLSGLPNGIELAIGANEMTARLRVFLAWCKQKGFICNVTMNQGHLKRDLDQIKQALKDGLIHGLGISYRKSLHWEIPTEILQNENVVFHCIVGIDSVQDILNLRDKGVKKLLCLGEKDFGFNRGKVDLNSQRHKEWYWWVLKLVRAFDVVSFDNLALEQLKIKRFLSGEKWAEFYQGEHSMYINAVERYFAPSSRSDERVKWSETTIRGYFATYDK